MITIGCALDDSETEMTRKTHEVRVCSHVITMGLWPQDRESKDRETWRKFIKDPEPGPLETM